MVCEWNSRWLIFIYYLFTWRRRHWILSELTAFQKKKTFNKAVNWLLLVTNDWINIKTNFRRKVDIGKKQQISSVHFMKILFIKLCTEFCHILANVCIHSKVEFLRNKCSICSLKSKVLVWSITQVFTPNQCHADQFIRLTLRIIVEKERQEFNVFW